MKRKILSISLLAIIFSAPLAGFATSWDDDDDIYYTPKRDKSNKNTQTTTQTNPVPSGTQQSTYIPNTVTDYPAADEYTPSGSGLNMSVDEYNRYGRFLVGDSIPSDTTDIGDTFTYTRRLERYYNPDIVNASNDTTLVTYYYEAQPTEVNVYVVNPYPYYTWSWASPWYWDSPYYYSSWAWSWGWGYYTPWYSWTWGYYPYYSWGWTWGHHHHHHWDWDCHPGHGGHGGHNHWASNSAGASRPHNPTGGVTNRHGEFRSGAGGHVATNSRPGNMGRGRSSASTGTTGSGYTPSSRSNSGGSYSGGSSSTSRGRNNSSVNNNNSRSNNNNRSTQRSNNNNNTRSRSGSYNNGGSHSGGHSGGGHSGGGGGGRRGRR